MSYWRFFYHIVWATKGRRPDIGPQEERLIRMSLESTISEIDAINHAIGMMPDHVHVVVSIPPKIAVSEAVRRMKGASTHALNASNVRREQPSFAWQPDYGALTFGERALDRVNGYVLSQRAHHADNDLWPSLERLSDPK